MRARESEKAEERVLRKGAKLEVRGKSKLEESKELGRNRKKRVK